MEHDDSTVHVNYAKVIINGLQGTGRIENPFEIYERFNRASREAGVSMPLIRAPSPFNSGYWYTPLDF
jgi:hypothetical protein